MIWHQLDTPLDVYRRVSVPDGAGGQATAWAYIGKEWAKLNQPRAAEREQAQQAGSAQQHIIHLDPEADVVRGDRLRHASANPERVKVESLPHWKVESTIAPSNSDVYLRAECELIQPEGVRP